MPKSKDQEVWIECEGVRCEEYANKTDGNAITCYIESQVDKVRSHNIYNGWTSF